MTISFNWNHIRLDDDQKSLIKEKIEDELNTALPEGINQANIIFYEYFPSILLKGMIFDNKENKIFDFTCSLSNSYNTTYTKPEK